MANTKHEVEVLPLVEERISVNKREVAGERIGVKIVTDSFEETVRQTLSHERLSISRVPCSRMVDAVPAIKTEGDLTVISIVEERLVVERQLWLTEELHIRKEKIDETVEQPVLLRKQRAVLESFEGSVNENPHQQSHAKQGSSND